MPILGFNWIKSGTSTLSGADPAEDDHFDNLPRYLYTDDVTGEALDPDQIYENIAGRTWSPFSLASYDTAHPIPLFSPGGTALGSFSEQALELSGIDNTPGVDIVITTDCSKMDTLSSFWKLVTMDSSILEVLFEVS